MLTGKNISLQKRNFKILDKVNIEVEKGEILIIIGPNGAGKSSLLSVLANEQETAEGEIYFKGKSFNQWNSQELAHYKAKFSQEFNSDIGLSVNEIVLMGRYPYFDAQPKSEDIEIVDSTMKMTDIYSLKNRAYNSLSGGEKQRVHLARVLSQLQNNSSEKLMFLDEPLNNLDVKHQRRILELIRKFVKKGNSAVLVLHDLSLAAEFADKMVLLKKGKVIAHGETRKIFRTEFISAAFDFPCHIFKNPVNSHPMVVFGEN
ncbi:MAG: heme ABC transporter ATP-binding protein [Weeksellaceae bacterium]|jgi:iron complex transport system ATP-binding protein|nr:heme ABC transporter ATP-binding protein [Weeksellaceae bacterium]MDX9704312.1 heme ABC transporter ATP-binding protein [Weeksellaceae bacterium]